jgi:hypothetical protein
MREFRGKVCRCDICVNIIGEHPQSCLKVFPYELKTVQPAVLFRILEDKDRGRVSSELTPHPITANF